MESHVYINELIGFLPIFRAVPKVLRVTDQYLLVEQTEDTIRITGTNGALIVIYQQKAQGNIGTGLLPVAAIKDLKRIKSKYNLEATLKWEESNRITILHADEIITKHIDHDPNAYPKYRQVIPTKVSNQTSQLNPDNLHIMKQVFTTITGHDALYVHHNGEGPAVVVSTYSQHIVGLLMPWNVEETPFEPILEKFRH